MTYSTNQKRRHMGAFAAMLLATTLAGFMASCGSSEASTSDSIKWIDAGEVSRLMTESLEAGHRSTTNALAKDGLEKAVQEVLSVEGWQLQDVSSRELVEELYLRAEHAEAGQGRRLLGGIYREAESRYGSLKEDARFNDLRRWADELDSGFKLSDLKFKAYAGAPSKLAPAADKAVEYLAYVYSDGNLSQVRDLAERAFRKPGFNFEKAMAQSANSRDALRRMVVAGTPPPAPEKALLDILEGVSSRSGAISADAELLKRTFDLKRELGLVDVPESRLQRFARVSSKLPSRVSQAARLRQSPRFPKPATVADDIARASMLLDGSAGKRKVLTEALARSAQSYSDYVSVSFEALDGAASLADGLASQGGGKSGFANYSTEAPRSNYRTRAASMGATPSNVVPRTFRAARFSPRGARGVAAGGSIENPEDAELLAIAWYANESDDQFGKLVALVEHSNGKRDVVASRTLFADSCMAALSILWGGHAGQTEFQEGSVLVLMSMDPFEEVESSGFLEDRRRVVQHPAVFGSELAWSITRVDFSFNDLGLLSEEASEINGGRAMPADLLSVAFNGAITWQFYEMDSTIKLDTASRSLSLETSSPTRTSSDAHYAVTMFGESEYSPDGLRRLQDTERELQPLLDWLASNHHDYMRLNHFAESFAFLRWAKAEKIGPMVVDMNGLPEPIEAPNEIDLASGPLIGG